MATEADIQVPILCETRGEQVGVFVDNIISTSMSKLSLERDEQLLLQFDKHPNTAAAVEGENFLKPPFTAEANQETQIQLNDDGSDSTQKQGDKATVVISETKEEDKLNDELQPPLKEDGYANHTGEVIDQSKNDSNPSFSKEEEEEETRVVKKISSIPEIEGDEHLEEELPLAATHHERDKNEGTIEAELSENEASARCPSVEEGRQIETPSAEVQDNLPIDEGHGETISVAPELIEVIEEPAQTLRDGTDHTLLLTPKLDDQKLEFAADEGTSVEEIQQNAEESKDGNEGVVPEECRPVSSVITSEVEAGVSLDDPNVVESLTPCIGEVEEPKVQVKTTDHKSEDEKTTEQEMFDLGSEVSKEGVCDQNKTTSEQEVLENEGSVEDNFNTAAGEISQEDCTSSETIITLERDDGSVTVSEDHGAPIENTLSQSECQTTNLEDDATDHSFPNLAEKAEETPLVQVQDSQLEEESEKLPSTDIVKAKDEDLIEAELSENDKDSLKAPPEEQSRDATQHGNTTEAEEATVDGQKEGLESCPPIVSSSPTEGSMNAALQEVLSDNVDVPENLSIDEACTEIDNVVPDITEVADEPDKRVGFLANEETSVDVVQLNAEESNSKVDVVPEQCSPVSSVVTSEVKAGDTLDDPDVDDTKVVTLIPSEENESHAPCIGEVEEADAQLKTADNKSEDEKTTEQDMSCDLRSEVSKEGESEPDKTTSGEEELENERSVEDKDAGGEVSLEDSASNSDELQSKSESKPSFSNEQETTAAVTASEEPLSESHGDEECQSKSLEDAVKDLSIPNLAEKSEETSLVQVQDSQIQRDEHKEAEPLTEVSKDIVQDKVEDIKEAELCEDIEESSLTRESVDATLHGNINEVEEATTDAVDGEQKESLESFPATASTSPEESLKAVVEETNEEIIDKHEQAEVVENLTIGEAHSEIITEKPDEKVKDDDTETLDDQSAEEEEEIRQNAETSDALDADDDARVVTQLSRDTGSSDQDISIMLEQTNIPSEEPESRDPCTTEAEDEKPTEGETDQNKAISDNFNTAAEEGSQENSASSETTTALEDYAVSEIHGVVESQPKALEEDAAAEKLEESSQLERDEHLEADTERLPLTETSTNDNVSDEKEVEFSEDSGEALHVAPACIEESDSRQENEVKEEQSTEAEEAQEDSVSEVVENVAVEENSETQVDCSKREDEEPLEKDNQDSSLTEAIVEETNVEKHVDSLQVKSEDVSVEEQILNTDPSETSTDNAVSDKNEESLEAKCGLMEKEESIETLQVAAEASCVAIADTSDANVLEDETPPKDDKDLTIGEAHSEVITEKPDETVRDDDTDDTLLLTPDQPVQVAADEEEIRQNAEEVNPTEKAVILEECHTDSLVDAMVVTKEILTETDIPTEETDSQDREACTTEGEELNVQVKTAHHEYEDEKPIDEDKSSDLSSELAKEGESDQNKVTSEQEAFESVADNSNTAAEEMSLEKGEESVTTSQNYGGVEGQPRTLEEDAAAEKLEESSQPERDEHLEAESERLPLTETSTNDNVSDEKEVQFSEDSAEALHVAPECIEESDSRQENEIKEEKNTEADEAQEDSVSEVVENVAVEDNSEPQVDCTEREDEEALVEEQILNTDAPEISSDNAEKEESTEALQVAAAKDIEAPLSGQETETSCAAIADTDDASGLEDETPEDKDLTIGEAHSEIITEKPDETVRDNTGDTLIHTTPDQPVEFAADEEIRQNAEVVNTTEKGVVPEECHTDSLVDVDDENITLTKEILEETNIPTEETECRDQEACTTEGEELNVQDNKYGDEKPTEEDDKSSNLTTKEGKSDQNKAILEQEVFESVEDNSITAAEEVSQENGASSETTTTLETSDFISSLSKEDEMIAQKGEESVTTSQDNGDVECQPKTLEEDAAAEKFEESSQLERDEHLELESERLPLTETSANDNVSDEKEVEFSEDSVESQDVAPECIEESDLSQENKIKEEQSTEFSLENVEVEENSETQVDCSEREDEDPSEKGIQDSHLTEATVEETNSTDCESRKNEEANVKEVEFSEDSGEALHVAPECIEESDFKNEIKEEQSTEADEAQEDSVSEVVENVAVEENSETQVDCAEREDKEPLEKDNQDSYFTEAIVDETNVEKHVDSLQVKSEDVSVEEQILNTDPSQTSTDNAERVVVGVSGTNEECLDEAKFFVSTKNSEVGLIEKEESSETLKVAAARDIEAPLSGQETETSCAAIADTDDANGLEDETSKDKQTEDSSRLEQNEDLGTDSENTPAPAVSIIQTSQVNEEEGVEKTVEEHIETSADLQQTCLETKENENIVDAKDDVVANVPNEEDSTPFELDGSQNPSSEETQAEKIDDDGPTAVHEANFANENTPKSNLSEEEEKKRVTALDKEEVCIESSHAADEDLKEATSSVQDSQTECDEHLEKESEKLPSTDNVIDKGEDLIEAESRQIETPAETLLVNTENDEDTIQAPPEEQSTDATPHGNTTEAEEATIDAVDGQKEGLENISIDEACTVISNVVPDITEVTEEPDQKVGIVANEETPVEDIQLNAEESNSNEKDGNGDVVPEQCSPVSSVVTSEVKAGDTVDEPDVDDAKVVTQIPEDTSMDQHGTIDSHAENITNIPSEETESHTPCIREVEELDVQLETTESKSQDEKTTEQDISCDLRSEVSKEGESEPNKAVSEEEALENERCVEDEPKDAAGEVSQEDSASTETTTTLEASNSDELQSKSEPNSSFLQEQETNVEIGDRSVTASEESLSESQRDEECQSKSLEDDVKDHSIPEPAEKSEETSVVQVQDSQIQCDEHLEEESERLPLTEVSTEATDDTVPPVTDIVQEQKESLESSPPTASTSTEEGSIKAAVQETPFAEDSPQKPPKGIIDEHESTTTVEESIIKAEDLMENREATLINEGLLIELAAEDIKEPCLNETNSEEAQILCSDNIENKTIDPMTETPKDEEKSSNLTTEKTEDLDVNEGIIEHIPEVSNYKQQEASITEVSEEHMATSNEHVSDDTSLESEVSMKNNDQVVEEANSCDEKTEVSNDGSIVVPANETLAETDSRGITEAEAQVPNGEDDAELQDSNASQDVSPSNVEIEEETETKETQTQDKELQDSSVEKIERDVQSCLASPSDSGITEEVQKLEEVPLLAQEDNITETTDCKESDVVEGATNNENIDHPEQNDTRESFPDDKRPTEEVLEERAANDMLPESPSESSGVDHYATERELTTGEGLCAEKTAMGDDEKELCEKTISDNISATPDVKLSRDTDVAKSTDKSDNIVDTMVDENTSVECIIVNERSATYLETENGDEAPDIKETTPSFAEGEDVESGNAENANYPGSLTEETLNSDEVESIVQADNTVANDTLEQEEASYEKENAEENSKAEDEDTKAYYQGSCEEDVIGDNHHEDELNQEQQKFSEETVELVEDGSQTETISKVYEEPEEKAVENQEEKISTNEAIDQILHQEEQAKGIEEPTPKIDTVEAREFAIASVKADIEDSTKEGVQIAIVPGKEIEDQNNEDEICSLDEVQAKDEENIVLSEGKSEEEAKETDTSTKLDEVEDKEVYIEAKKLDFVSQTEGTSSECKVSDGARIPEENEISTTKECISEEDHPSKHTEVEVSSASEDVAPTEQASEASIVTAKVQAGAAAPEATGIESQEVEEVNGQCAAMEEPSASMVPPVSSTSKIIQDWIVEPPLETEDQHTEVQALSRELNIKDSEVKVAEKDDVVNLQSVGDITEGVQGLSKESFEVSDHESPVRGDAEEKMEIKEPQEKKSAPDAIVLETLDQETEKQPGSGTESSIHQSSVEETAQHEKGEGCQQMDSPLSLPQAQLSDIETSEKDLPVHVAAEVEVSPLLSKDKHVVLDADGARNLNHDNQGGDKNISTEYSQRELEIEKPASLSDLFEVSMRERTQKADHPATEEEPENSEEAEHENLKTDEEKDDEEESHEQQKADLASEAPVIVDMGDADLKVAHKKSHNILSGVGSKVKHSIAKVKKAITGKSSHPKTPSPKKVTN